MNVPVRLTTRDKAGANAALADALAHEREA